jgi:hypothetical protein
VYFPEVDRIEYEGPHSKNPMALRHHKVVFLLACLANVTLVRDGIYWHAHAVGWRSLELSCQIERGPETGKVFLQPLVEHKTNILPADSPFSERGPTIRKVCSMAKRQRANRKRTTKRDKQDAALLLTRWVIELGYARVLIAAVVFMVTGVVLTACGVLIVAFIWYLLKKLFP